MVVAQDGNHSRVTVSPASAPPFAPALPLAPAMAGPPPAAAPPPSPLPPIGLLRGPVSPQARNNRAANAKIDDFCSISGLRQSYLKGFTARQGLVEPRVTTSEMPRERAVRQAAITHDQSLLAAAGRGR